MKSYDLKTEYLSIRQIAEATGVCDRTLQDRCKKNKYVTRQLLSVGRGGVKYEILVSSLEPELIEKIVIYQSPIDGEENAAGVSSSLSLIENNVNSISNYSYPNRSGAVLSAAAPLSLVSNKTNHKSSLNSSGGENNISKFSAPVSFKKEPEVKFIPEDARRIALAKYDVIRHWQEYRADKSDKKQADKDFISGYNNGFIADDLLKLTGLISRASLYRWQKLLKGCNDYRTLINDYNYTGESQLNTTLTEVEIREFIRIYYNDAQMNLETSYNLLKYKFEMQGIRIHSVSAFRKYAKYISRNHKDIEVLSRKGEKAYNDEVGMYLHRDISDVCPGEVLVADGNKLDFTVLNPFTGRPVRATLVVYLDWISFDVAGYEIMLSENTQCISSALRNSILRLGKFPKRVYMDNGKAFRGTYFTGCKNFKDCGFQGIYASLGVELIIARAYSGRSKVVERFFRNFVQSCPPLISSYIGNCIEHRPAHHRRNETFHKELHKDDKIPTIEQAKAMIEAWLNYYRSRPCPHDESKSIGQVFAEGCGAGVNTEMLDELMLANEVRTAKRNIIRIFGLEYSSSALHGLDTKVVVKYSLFDISKIKVYSLKGEYICEAPLVTYVKAIARDGSAVDMYNYKMQLKQQKELRRQAIQKTKAVMGAANPFKDFDWSAPVEQKTVETRQKPKLEITCYENIHKVQKTKIEY